LEFLGETAAARGMESAVLRVLADQRELTADLGGTGTTESVTAAVLEIVGNAR
ncbi:MAG: tartrate dehydrogenase, partial [Acidobacteria bacterium]|nr:tartrate dehydrogenase [Acidobacteriota bacterium]